MQLHVPRRGGRRTVRVRTLTIASVALAAAVAAWGWAPLDIAPRSDGRTSDDAVDAAVELLVPTGTIPDELTGRAAPGRSTSEHPGPACLPDGCLHWARRAPGLAAGHGDTVHLVAEGQLHALDALTGDTRWSRPIGTTHTAWPVALASRDGRAVVASAGRVRSFADDGTERWSSDIVGFVVRSLVIGGEGHVVVLTRPPSGAGPYGRLTVLDAANGEERWGREVAAIESIGATQVAVRGIGGDPEHLEVATGTPIPPPEEDAAAASAVPQGLDTVPVGRARAPIRGTDDPLSVWLDGAEVVVPGRAGRVLIDDPPVVHDGARVLGLRAPSALP